MLQSGETHQRLFTYSRTDTLDLPHPLVSMLSYFDGRPVAEVQESILEMLSMRLDEGFLRHLLDYGLLVTCEES